MNRIAIAFTLLTSFSALGIETRPGYGTVYCTGPEGLSQRAFLFEKSALNFHADFSFEVKLFFIGVACEQHNGVFFWKEKELENSEFPRTKASHFPHTVISVIDDIDGSPLRSATEFTSASRFETVVHLKRTGKSPQPGILATFHVIFDSFESKGRQSESSALTFILSHDDLNNFSVKQIF